MAKATQGPVGDGTHTDLCLPGSSCPLSSIISLHSLAAGCGMGERRVLQGSPTVAGK